MVPQTRNNLNHTEGNSGNDAQPSSTSLEAILEYLISAIARMEERMERQMQNQIEHQTQMLNTFQERVPQDNARVPVGENNNLE